MHATGAYLLLDNIEIVQEIVITGTIENISGSFSGRIPEEAIAAVKAKIAEKRQQAKYVLLAWGVRVNYTSHTRSLIEINRIAVFECQKWTRVETEQGP